MGIKFEEKNKKKDWEINVKRITNSTEMHEVLNTLSSEIFFREAKRNTMLFKLGCISGLRISDLVDIKRTEVEGKENFTLIEKKTGKKRTIYLKPVLLDLIQYLNWLDSNNIKNEYLFYNSRKKPEKGHIKEDQFYKILRKVGDLLNLDHLGTHTMRKTFGFTVYQDKKDIRLVMDLLNHSSEKITLRYIGISEEQKKNTVENIDFFK